MAPPKKTEAQKAADKAAREEAKKNAPGAADRAEARSANGKMPKAAAAAVASSQQNTDDLDREEKALFLHHLPLLKAAKEALNTANANLRNLYKKAKAEGNFTKADFDTAFALETAEKEARERAKIARQLKIARIVGSSMGNQLDMFLEPDRTPAVDIAKEEGERDALSKKPAKPKYDPSTPQHKAYMDAWHAANASLIEKGIGKLHPAVAEDVEQTTAQKAAVAAQKVADAEAFDAEEDAIAEPQEEPAPAPKPMPQSGTPMTRAQFKAKMEAEKASAAAK